MNNFKFVLVVLAWLATCFINEKPKEPVNISQKDTVITDTMRYIQSTIIDHQSDYIHNQFKKVIADLRLPIKSYVPDLTSLHTIPKIIIFFDKGDTVENRLNNKRKIYSLTIVFENPPSKDSAFSLVMKDHGEWSPMAKAFYGERIVSFMELLDGSYKNTKKQ
jgi:hypothetical protein